MRRHVDQRQERVVTMVRRLGRVRLSALAEELGVSAVTVRRDVETLVAQGRLRRLHGVVVWPDDGPAAEPQGAASGLIVGMVVPSTEYYYAPLLRGAQETVARHGGRLVLGVNNYRASEDEDQVRRLLEAGADGLLVTPSWPDGLPEPGQESLLLSLEVPTVLVERRPPLLSPLSALDCVRSDHVGGAAAAVQHLAELGHTRIALLAQKTPTLLQLREGYAAALASLGVDTEPPLDRSFSSDPTAWDEAADELFRAFKDQGVRAALVHNDQSALRVLHRLQDHGLRIPEDFALVTYDDELAQLADPPLTAVAPPKYEVGAAAAELLLEKIERARSDAAEPSVPRHVLLRPQLRVRGSSGPRSSDAQRISK